MPVFGHLPLIMGPDRKRLSKRTGAASVEEFRDQGILPQALYNFLALLGWSPGDDREVMSRAEMIEAFTVERLVPSAAIFDYDKLRWMNAQYMSRSRRRSGPHLEPFLADAGLAGVDLARLDPVLELHRTRARTLAELAQVARPILRAGARVRPRPDGQVRGPRGATGAFAAVGGRRWGRGGDVRHRAGRERLSGHSARRSTSKRVTSSIP